jgi:ribosomal protein S18 acetylase RimI-like enzyme
MSEQIQLRPATPADTETLAQLWVATFPDKFGPILGAKAEAVLCDWLRLSRHHLKTTTVAEIEGAVGGFIALETPAAPRGDDGRWFWYALQLHHGIFGALRGLIMMTLIDNNHQPDAGEVYIEMLGVAPAWRGRGIARALLKYAETVARSDGVPWLTLEVVSDNAPALQLYQNFGFKIKKVQHNRLLKWITGHPGFLEMVKPLDL